MICFVKERSNYYNFDNCLFNLNFIDLIDKNELEDKVKKI